MVSETHRNLIEGKRFTSSIKIDQVFQFLAVDYCHFNIIPISLVDSD